MVEPPSLLHTCSMGVSCHVEIEGVPYTPRKPYVFASCPRVGDVIILPHGEEGTTAEFAVVAVVHVPDRIDNDLSAFTVLHAKGPLP